MTVKELMDQLSVWPPDTIVTFGQQSFNRVKRRAENLVDIELMPMPYYDSDKEVWHLVGDLPPEEFPFDDE